MNEIILKKLTVRIRINETTGTGTIVKNNQGKYFVLTARHCLYGSEEENKNLSADDIIIEFAPNNDNAFKSIKASNIEYEDSTNDIALISIQDFESDVFDTFDISYAIFEDIRLGEQLVLFRGYPRRLHLANEADNYRCKLIKSDSERIIISSDKLSDPTGITELANNTQGLSGSSVFLFEDNLTYILGVITESRDESCSFGELICNKIPLAILNQFNFNTSNPFGLQELQKASRNIDRASIERAISEYPNENNQEYTNLKNKCRILYDESADEMIVSLLSDYFEGKFYLDKIQKQSPFIYELIYTNTLKELSKKVKRTYNNRLVNNKNEAQVIFGEIEDIFTTIINNAYTNRYLVKDNISSKVTTELLLNCDLNFKPV